MIFKMAMVKMILIEWAYKGLGFLILSVSWREVVLCMLVEVHAGVIYGHTLLPGGKS
jgi:hypothetical protein